MKKDKKPHLTIICPVFNEETVINLFFNRIFPVIKKLNSHYQVDLLFINNASTDKTYDAIQKIRKLQKFVYLITLSNNVGYQKSLDCGVRNAKGDIICFIDVDCEDPPEMIIDFIRLYEKGYDLVYGVRIDRHENYIVKKARNYFYTFLRQVADDEVILYMAEFCLMTSEVRNAVILHETSFPFIRTHISRVGFNRTGIEYKRQKRIAGESHYNLLGMAVFAVAGILSASTLPLRLPIYLFPLFIFLTALFGMLYLNTINLIYIFIAILVVITYFGFAIAFIALYVARTYKNVLGYPNYFIDHRLTNFQD